MVKLIMQRYIKTKKISLSSNNNKKLIPIIVSIKIIQLKVMTVYIIIAKII